MSKRNTDLRLLSVVSMVYLLAAGVVTPTAAAAQESTGTKTTTTTTTTTAPGGDVLALRSLNKHEAKAERLKHLDQTKLHRLDWRVTGSGCASCLGRVRKRIDKLNGVYEVAVAIKPPYGVAVIYDASKVSMEEILRVGVKDETVKIEFVGPEDKKIAAPPMLLIPVHNNMNKTDDTVPASH